MHRDTCDACGKSLPRGFRLRGGGMYCLWHALRHPAVVRRAVKTALVVGTVLTAINQGDRILQWDITAFVVFKMVLTYCVLRLHVRGPQQCARSLPAGWGREGYGCEAPRRRTVPVASVKATGHQITATASRFMGRKASPRSDMPER